MQRPHLFRRFSNSLRGIRAVWALEQPFRWRVALVVVVFALAFLAALPFSHVLLLVVASGAMLSAEIANTALEEVCDIIEPRFNARIGAVKDMLSATVFVAALPLVAIALVDIAPRLMGRV